MSDINVIQTDEYKVYDKLYKKMKKNPGVGPLGWVRVYYDHKLHHEGPNMVVAQGREFVAQKIYQTNAYSGGTRNNPNFINYKVSHFGVGSGGATVVGEAVTLNGPHVLDKGLYQAIPLGAGYLTDPGANGNSNTLLAVKPIATSGSIFLEPETYTDGRSGASPTDYYTKVKCTCTVPAAEPSYLAEGGTVQISEATLYCVNSTSVALFAHICFAPKFKEREASMTIIWYTLC